MLAIGVDPGIAITGYGLVQESADGSLQAVEYGAILTAAGEPLPRRLASLHEQLCQVLSRWQPECGAVEKLFFARNARTALTVGQARGVTLLALEQAGIPLVEYTPLEVKQSIAGYGGADKNQVQQMVKALLSLDQVPQPDDAADALAIAICHLHSYRLRGLMEG